MFLTLVGCGSCIGKDELLTFASMGFRAAENASQGMFGQRYSEKEIQKAATIASLVRLGRRLRTDDGADCVLLRADRRDDGVVHRSCERRPHQPGRHRHAAHHTQNLRRARRALRGGAVRGRHHRRRLPQGAHARSFFDHFLRNILLLKRARCSRSRAFQSMTPAQYRGALGATMPHPDLLHHQAFGVEFFITFVLLFTVFASTDPLRTDLNGSTPLTVGLSVGVCHLWAVSSVCQRLCLS